LLKKNVCSLFPPQNFLLLEEVKRPHSGLPLKERKENSVEIEKLTCYWDKVNIPMFQ